MRDIRKVLSFCGTQLSKREILLAREAYARGASNARGEFETVDDVFPLPREPRIIRQGDCEYRMVDDQLEFRRVGGFGGPEDWTPLSPPEYVRALRDLVNNPFEP